MKRILSIITASMVILLFLPVHLNAQEVKTEKKIKIIIDDGSGKKVIIDTLVNDDSDIETIKTDDGKIILIAHESDTDPVKNHKESKLVTVTVTDDDTLISEGQNDVTVLTEKGDKGDGEKVIVVKKVKSTDGHSENSYDVSVTSDDKPATEKTRLVVARDGMVVTVEGKDEAKARELMKMIENYMGVNDKGEAKSEKSETKKSSKK